MENYKIEIVFDAAKEYFGDGIYVKSGQHPCGWDWISFESIDDYDELFSHEIEIFDISNGIYYNHEFEGLTIPIILGIVGESGFCFELSGVDSLE